MELIGVISADGRTGGSVITHTGSPTGCSPGRVGETGSASQRSPARLCQAWAFAQPVGPGVSTVPSAPREAAVSPAAAQPLLLTGLHSGRQEGLSSGLKLRWSLQELNPGAPTHSGSDTVLRLVPVRRTRPIWDFTAASGSPLTHSWGLSAWALAHGHQLDSVPWQGQGSQVRAGCSSLSLCPSQGSPPCPLPSLPGSTHSGNT